MTAPVTLTCPKCGYSTESTRRGSHAPCPECMVAGRGVVTLAAPVAPPHIEAKEPAAAPPAVRMLGAMSGVPFVRDCKVAGHFFVGPEACGFCGCPQAKDPCDAREQRRLEAEHAARAVSL